MVIKNFVERLDQDSLKFVSDRLGDKLHGDMYDVLHFIEKEHKDIDKWLASAKSSDDFYKMVDEIADSVKTELSKRI
jgi:CRISPR-associated protein Cas8b1/Cst1 subtype I-B